MSLITESRIQYPDGAVTRLAPADAAAITTEAIWNRKTVIDMPAAGQHTTLNLTIDAELEDGAELVVNMDQGATPYNLVPGTNIVGDGITGVANDKDTILLQYKKTAGTFRVVSVFKTEDAA